MLGSGTDSLAAIDTGTTGVAGPQQYISEIYAQIPGSAAGTGKYEHYYTWLLEDSDEHKKRRGNLPKAATNLLKKWLMDHLYHPYPTEDEKMLLANQTSLSLNQISNW